MKAWLRVFAILTSANLYPVQCGERHYNTKAKGNNLFNAQDMGTVDWLGEYLKTDQVNLWTCG